MTQHSSNSLPRGFLASGIAVSIKESGNKDLGLIFSRNGTTLGAVYTQNKFPSAHVQYCKPLTPSTDVRALIVNSGNANAAGGERGREANFEMVSVIARLFKIQTEQVFSSSTGIIGELFPIQKIKQGIPRLIKGLENDGQSFAEAILTTDTCTKTFAKEIIMGENSYRIWGVAKGSGMICPNMGTLLAYLLTDIPIPFNAIQDLTQKVADVSFNRITVDGDTSTNDSFYLLSSGKDYEFYEKNVDRIYQALCEVAIELAKQIASDGEGAKHLIELEVTNAPDERIAQCVSRGILNSNLVKTAIHGHDPNWGRILVAIGNHLPENIEKNFPVSISIQGTVVYRKGEPVAFEARTLSKKMEEHQVNIEVNLHQGKMNSKGWSCDLTREYIAINADYTT